MRRLLVANRGEIALRIIRAARELDIGTVAVYSDADADSLHVRDADEAVRIGPPPATESYLNILALIDAARRTEVDAVHPGYGFLAENAEFAARCLEEGFRFVGPDPHAISLMGDKAAARASAASVGVPVVPGCATDDDGFGLVAAREVGFPLLIKAAAGGGGRGIRLVEHEAELENQLIAARAEAAAAFGDGTVYLERFIAKGRHVEVQVFGDGARAVHLYERECSLQRRRQKLVEEAPAANLEESLKAKLFESAVRLAESVDYRGAGTVEFIVDPTTGEHFFLEMNTRIQVEHPVTEMICGIDLVREQLRQADGLPMTVDPSTASPRGAAIEMRINAEDPEQGFLPSPGIVTALRLPMGPGVRVSAAIEAGGEVAPHYDSLIAKIIVWDVDRPAVLARARRALREFNIEGIKTTAGLISELLEQPEVRDGGYDTGFVESWLERRREGESA